MDTAIALFTSKGVAHTSLRDVIKAMNGGRGVGMSVFYYYFDSKSELISACLDRYFDRYADDLVCGMEDPDSSVEQVVSNLVGLVIDAVNDVDTMFDNRRLGDNFLDTNPDIRERFTTRITSSMAAALERLTREGRLPETALSRTGGPQVTAMLVCSGTISIFTEGRSVLKDGKLATEAALAYLSGLLGIDLTHVEVEAELA